MFNSLDTVRWLPFGVITPVKSGTRFVVYRCTTLGRCRDHKGIVRRSAKYFKYWQFLYKFNFACPKNYFPLWFHLPKKICYSGHYMILLVPYTKICYSGHNMILLVPYTKILDTTFHTPPPLSPLISGTLTPLTSGTLTPPPPSLPPPTPLWRHFRP